MPRGRKPTGTEPKAARADRSSADETLAYQCGLFGLTETEATAKLTTLADSKLLELYNRGKADHAFEVMSAIFQNAMDGREKLLIWLAENSLQRTAEHQTGNALIDAMSPQQRRDRIRELTKLVAVNG